MGEPKVKKPRKLSDVQLIVIRLVTNMKGCYHAPTWSREGALAKRLIEKYGADFMHWVPPPENIKVSSLLWFADNLGQRYLDDQILAYRISNGSLTPKKEEIILSQDKIGDDITITKQKTLKDFLKTYG
jgi:hypothetical protein